MDVEFVSGSFRTSSEVQASGQAVVNDTDILDDPMLRDTYISGGTLSAQLETISETLRAGSGRLSDSFRLSAAERIREDRLSREKQKDSMTNFSSMRASLDQVEVSDSFGQVTQPQPAAAGVEGMMEDGDCSFDFDGLEASPRPLHPGEKRHRSSYYLDLPFNLAPANAGVQPPTDPVTQAQMFDIIAQGNFSEISAEPATSQQLQLTPSVQETGQVKPISVESQQAQQQQAPPNSDNPTRIQKPDPKKRATEPERQKAEATNSNVARCKCCGAIGVYTKSCGKKHTCLKGKCDGTKVPEILQRGQSRNGIVNTAPPVLYRITCPKCRAQVRFEVKYECVQMACWQCQNRMTVRATRANASA